MSISSDLEKTIISIRLLHQQGLLEIQQKTSRIINSLEDICERVREFENLKNFNATMGFENDAD